MSVPSLNELLRLGEAKLSLSLNGNVMITTHTKIEDTMTEKIMTIDHTKFRKDLWYSREELKSRISKPGFFCLLVLLDGEPIAYDFGFDADDKGVFFSDSSASIIERKGVGTVIAVLEMVYLYENGYKAVKFTTEELDQEGRPLRQIWENLGYKTVSTDPISGVTMMMDITQDVILQRIRRHITQI